MMTEEQKEILIAKMLETPSSLSDEELEAILHDEELRDLYNVSSAVSSAFVRQPEFDMEAEWKCIRPRIRRKPTTMHWVMRAAAIFLGVTLASGVAVKIIDNVFTYDQPPVIANAEQSNELKSSQIAQHNPQTTEIKNHTQIESASNPGHSSKHPAKVEKNKLTPPPTQVDTETDIDIDEFLRIQQARIDNDLAMLVAASYIEEYDNLAPILNIAGVSNQELDNTIRKITME